MTHDTAYFLIWHGSRDRRSQQASYYLTHLVRQELAQTRIALVGVAPLELSPVPLPESLAQFVQQADKQGIQRVRILPLFLLPGVHVTEDIPQQVQQVQTQLCPHCQLEILPYLGTYPHLLGLLSQSFAKIPQTRAKILLSHGSRKAGANDIIAQLAKQLQARPAYWSVSPDLATQIENFVTDGQTEIAIQPYFLFTGGITDAIATQVDQLQLRFANVTLLLGQPLGATPELAQCVIESLDEKGVDGNRRI